MKAIREAEQSLLKAVCEENKVPPSLLSKLLRSAEAFAYENTSATVRRKEYLELIEFHARRRESGEN